MIKACPTCGYDLSGHRGEEIVCPECGLVASEDPRPFVRAGDWLGRSAVPTLALGAFYLVAMLVWGRGPSEVPGVVWTFQLVAAGLSPVAMLLWATAASEGKKNLTAGAAGRIVFGGCGLNLLIVILTVALLVLIMPSGR